MIPAEERADRVALARACRVLAHRGLVEDVLGHVSLRVAPDRVLLRCRGPHESGLRFTVPTDVRAVDLDGRIVDGGEDEGYAPPSEAPIHLETLRRRPDANAVVHAHPPAVVAAGLADLPLLPIFGSYDIPAARLAAGGIPVYPRSVLVRRAELAHEMLAVMGDSSVCVLRALAVDRLSRTALAVVGAGGTLRPIPHGDLAELPDLGAGLNEHTLWRFHLAALAADGWDLTPDQQADGAEGDALDRRPREQDEGAG